MQQSPPRASGGVNLDKSQMYAAFHAKYNAQKSYLYELQPESPSMIEGSHVMSDFKNAYRKMVEHHRDETPYKPAFRDIEDLEHYENHREFEDLYDHLSKWNENRQAKIEEAR